MSSQRFKRSSQRGHEKEPFETRKGVMRHACITFMRRVWLSLVRECLGIVNNPQTFHDNAAVSYQWKCECGWWRERENLRFVEKESQASLCDISAVHAKLQGALMEEINCRGNIKKNAGNHLTHCQIQAQPVLSHICSQIHRGQVHKFEPGIRKFNLELFLPRNHLRLLWRECQEIWIHFTATACREPRLILWWGENLPKRMPPPRLRPPTHYIWKHLLLCEQIFCVMTIHMSALTNIHSVVTAQGYTSPVHSAHVCVSNYAFVRT